MKILTISGSVRKNASNVKLLEALPFVFPKYQFSRFKKLEELPLFHADLQDQPLPPVVDEWKAAILTADAMVICTPVYLYNLPALLKNALEWVTASGELYNKRVLAMTFTPNPPRGEKAMQSLSWSLQALNANIVAQLALYQTEISFDKNDQLVDSEHVDLLKAAVHLLVT